MHEKNVLNYVQWRVLFALLFSPVGKLNNREIMQACEISSSTWNKEKKALWLAGLLDTEDRKEFDDDGGGVKRRTLVSLTAKGKLVAGILSYTSEIIAKPYSEAAS